MKITRLIIFAMVMVGLVSVTHAGEVDWSITATQEFTQIVGSARSPHGRVKKISMIRESGGRVSWSRDGEYILMDRKGKDGYYDIYRVRPDGSDEICLTCDLPEVLGSGHIGQP